MTDIALASENNDDLAREVARLEEEQAILLAERAELYRVIWEDFKLVLRGESV